MSSQPTDYIDEYIKVLEEIKKRLKGLNNDSWYYWDKHISKASAEIDLAIKEMKEGNYEGEYNEALPDKIQDILGAKV